MTIRIEPQSVAQAVDAFVDDELRSARKFDNREPLDESGIWSLHNLAAEIYAMAWEDATRAADQRTSQQRAREHDRRRAELATAITSNDDQEATR